MPAKIEILSGKREGDVIELGDDPLDIGNRKTAKLSIRDPWISWNHAKIFRESEKWVIEDLGSSNGTWINGKKVKRENLNAEEVVFLGKTKVRFSDGTTVVAPIPEAPGGTTMLPPGTVGLDAARFTALEAERDDLRKMLAALERFLDVTPAERAALGGGKSAAPEDDSLRTERDRLALRVSELEAKVRSGSSASADVAAIERQRNDLMSKNVELEGKAVAAEAQVIELEARLRTLTEQSKKDSARAKEKLEAELTTTKQSLEDALARARSLEESSTQGQGELRTRLAEVEQELEHARGTAIEAERSRMKLESALDTARRSAGASSAKGESDAKAVAELGQARAKIAELEAERDELRKKNDEIRAEIDQISMEQIEIEEELKQKIEELEAQLKSS